MHFNVTYIDFDFDDEHISKDERVEITQDHIGTCEAAVSSCMDELLFGISGRLLNAWVLGVLRSVTSGRCRKAS